MNEPPPRRPLPRLVIVLAAGFGCVALSGCGSSSHQATRSGGNTGAYASYPADGHYNPYPTAPQGTVTRYQEYTEAPPPPVEEPKPKVASSGATASRATASTSPSTKKTTTKKKPSTATTASKPATSKSSGRGTVHLVKPKDTLWGIARKYHTTISKLKSANGLSSDLIRDGQKLKIP